MLRLNRKGGYGLFIRRARTILAIMLFGVLAVLVGCGPNTAFSVSGRVTLGGAGLSGVTLAFSGTSSTAVTDTEGNWSRSGLSGTVTITPAKTGYTFVPVSTTVNSACTNVNFVAQAPPAIPTGLTAVGSLGQIQLSWNPSASATGYNIYRGTNESNLVKVTATPITETVFTDPISSPAGDGVWYYYKVTSVCGQLESAFSSLVRSMHGTRLSGSYAGGFSTTTAGSPYVVEGAIMVEGNFLIDHNTRLYVLDNGTINVQAGYNFWIYGYLKVMASSGASHATITAHKAGGGLPDSGTGFGLVFNEPDPGCLIQNTLIEYLENGASLAFINTNVTIRNSRIAYRGTTGQVEVSISGGSGPAIENCRLDGILFWLNTDLRYTGFSLKNCFLRNNNSAFMIIFDHLTLPAGVNGGQITQNNFDGTKRAHLIYVSGTGLVPMGNNYWSGGTGYPPLPTVTVAPSGPDLFDFYPALTSPPATGPDW